MNILFVCKHNKFRSKIAEAYFKKINRNKNLKAESAGIIKSYLPFKKSVVKITKEFGIRLKGKSGSLDTNLIKKQDLIIIVADDVPRSFFDNWEYVDKKTKIVQWNVKDNVGGTSAVKIRRIIKEIIKKVDSLVKKLEKEK